MQENNYALEQAVKQLKRLKHKLKWGTYIDEKNRQTKYRLYGKDNNRNEVDIRGTKAHVFDSAIKMIAKEFKHFN